MERSAIKHGIVHLSLSTHAPVDPRDRNAASNIAENFYRLYEGKPCLGKLTAPETALHKALGKLED